MLENRNLHFFGAIYHANFLSSPQGRGDNINVWFIFSDLTQLNIFVNHASSWKAGILIYFQAIVVVSK
jgi:hypothetical protein